MSHDPEHVTFATDVVLQVIDGEALILKLHEEVVFALNTTGTRIAQLISDGHSIERVIETLGNEYGKSRGEVAPEVRDLVRSLLSKGLVVPSQSGTAT